MRHEETDDEVGLVHDQDFDLGVHLGDTPTDSLGPEDIDSDDLTEESEEDTQSEDLNEFESDDEVFTDEDEDMDADDV